MVCFGRQDREVMIMKKFCILVIVAALDGAGECPRSHG
jgi:hypothetical protein